MRAKLLPFLFLVFSSKLLGQIGFQETAVTGSTFTTYSPECVKAADIDNDGDLDIIAYGSQITWYENIDGLGNFGEKKVIAGIVNGGIGTSLQVVDLDNDGDVDLLCSTGNKFTTYKNTNGLGNFQVIQNFTLGINSSTGVSVAPADMDNDGDLDILSSYVSSNGQLLVWFQNNGSGSVGAEQLISNNSALIASTLVSTEDLDGDNDEDIIVGNRSYSKILWIENNGNGAFGTPVTISNLSSGIMALATSDIDHDGDMDIISGSANDNQIAWYKNLDGQGTFSDEIIITSNATATNAFLVVDINHDNTNDIVYTGTNEIGWLSNNGSGTFGNQQPITTKAFGVRSVFMADLDQDGKDDLISASREDDKIAWYKHDGNGNFGRQVVIGKSVASPNNIYPGDFDGDQDIDLLINSQHDAKLTWLENVNGLGFYGKEHIITEDTDVGNITPIAYPADIDGDGDLDVVVNKDTTLLWYENVDGQGNFTTEHIMNNLCRATLIRCADMDGDGDMDVVCGVYNADKFSWYKNNGGGNFGTELIIADSGGNNGSLTSLEIADMDADGDMDIIASSYDWDMFFFKNTNGLGNFALQNMGVFGSMMAVYPADIDGDGDKDIVGVSAMGGGSFDAVVWYENENGQGVFNTAHDISTLDVYGESIHAADLDGDGDMDVLTTGGHSQVSGMLAWYPNNGSGTFAARQIIHERNDYTTGQCVNVADIDNDNDPDVLSVFGYSANYFLSRVSVFENLGNLGNTVYGKVLVDVNANGCTDDDLKGRNLMVIANEGSHSFATFTDENGVYQMAATAGSFTTAISSEIPDYFVSNPASHAFVFSGMNNTQQANFCVAPLGQINDLTVSVLPLNEIRPGSQAFYRVVYRNIGTTTLSGNVNFEYNNNKLAFLTTNQTVASQTANTLTFDFSNLAPFETKTINLAFNVFAPPTTNLNDQILCLATINPLTGDETEADNSFTLHQTVIGSYDPNDITCLEGRQVLIEDADQYLHYVIRFQNTGTASAINVAVENTLDNKLDWTSMQLENLSHSGRVEIKDGSAMKFIFDGIHLPDSTTNEPGSHGFIAYKIKPSNTVAVGDIVNNTAAIYFDYNPPIVTNTAATRFVNTLSVAQTDTSRFEVYPNPANSLLNIKANAAIESVTLIDTNGRILKDLSFEIPVSITQIDLTGFTNGIYFVRIKSPQGNVTKKIVKQ